MSSALLLLAGVMFGLAGLAAIARIIIGPTNLDRVVAADVLTATLVCWLGVWMIANKDTTLLPVLIALALFAIVGTVSVARLLARKEED